MNYDKQANDFCAKYGVEIIKNYVGTKKHFPNDKEQRDVYEIIVKRGDKHFTMTYGDSIKNTEENYNRGKRIKPSNYDILCSLEKYGYEDVDDFASGLGIEKPSEAIRIFEAVNKNYKDVSNMFTEDELVELSEIQ